MAKVNVSSEIVENHSDEEVLDWAIQMLSRATTPSEGEQLLIDVGCLLYEVEFVMVVLIRLRDKKSPKEPVVAS